MNKNCVLNPPTFLREACLRWCNKFFGFFVKNLAACLIYRPFYNSSPLFDAPCKSLNCSLCVFLSEFVLSDGSSSAFVFLNLSVPFYINFAVTLTEILVKT